MSNLPTKTTSTFLTQELEKELFESTKMSVLHISEIDSVSWETEVKTSSFVQEKIIEATLESESFFEIHPHPPILDAKDIYTKNREVFRECEYMFDRHNVKICLAVFKTEVDICGDDFRKMLRLTDKYISTDNPRHHVVIFTFTNSKMAYQAAMRIEKALLRRYPMFTHSDILSCRIVQKKIDNETIDIFKKICLSVENPPIDVVVEN